MKYGRTFPGEQERRDLTRAREPVEKCRLQNTKSQRFLKMKKIQRFSLCLASPLRVLAG
jgi:hypothetical protein